MKIKQQWPTVLAVAVAAQGSPAVADNGATTSYYDITHETVQRAVELVPPSAPLPPEKKVELKPEIAKNLDRGLAGIESALRQMPDYSVKMIERVKTYGLPGIAYDDPELKAKGRELGEEIGRGIRSVSDAVERDMTDSTAKAGAQHQ